MTAGESPCRKICQLGQDGLCDGCGRTIEEIGHWMKLSMVARTAIGSRVSGWTPRVGSTDAPTAS